MPVIERRSSGAPIEELVEGLASELRQSERGSQPYGQPLILPKKIGRSDAFNVFVVWDRWDGHPAPDRSSTIREAYRRFDPAMEARIPIAEGFTFHEAVIEGLLPVKLVPLFEGGEPYSREDVTKAMRDAAVFAMPGNPQLRFPTIASAKSTLRKLNGQFPELFAVFVEQSSEDALNDIYEDARARRSP